jgi:hypothetical protein
MAGYTMEELEAAQKALFSSYKKTDKARDTLLAKQTPPKSQLTLVERNLNALRIALGLIAEEMSRQDMDSYNKRIDEQNQRENE